MEFLAILLFVALGLALLAGIPVAFALAGVGLGFVLTMPLVTWAGIICGIFGIVLKEKGGAS